MEKAKSIILKVLKAVALGMSVSCIVLGYLGTIEIATQISLLAFGLFLLSVAALQQND